ncbi:fibronectin-binding domain-containing protein [ANME-1 cluster archaeon GoMg4]|nr:fibronectin-binding domain-containing protein [ANME-1 cluster archaeon GoMg4]
MKESMSSVDIAAIVTELQELIGARLVKAYQQGKDEIRLKLHQKEIGSLDLIIEAGRRIHLTKYKRPSPRMPSNFAMYIRKHLGGGRIAQIRQLDFDRIVEITVERWDKKIRLIAELLPRGNLVLVDENGDIMLPLRRKSFSTREIKVRTKYERPPSRENPLITSELERTLTNLCKSTTQDKDVVRVLASSLSLGGLYAEEVCEKAGVDKNKKANELTETELKSIYGTVRTLLEPILSQDKSQLKAHIVLEAEEKVDVLPFELNTYKTREKEFFTSFNDAADEFFTMQIAEAVEEQAKTEHEKGISKYERVLNEQLDALQKFERKEAEWIKKGELIYARYVEIEEQLRGMVKKRKVVTLTLPDTDLPLEIDTSVSLQKNASAYYERGKVFKKKRAGVARAIEETKERIRTEKAKELEIKEELIPEKKEVRREKEEWYEKFRWFDTSDGFLVIGGKDATTNEILVKRYMAPEDLFCHTQAEGAPVVIAKTGGKDVSEQGLREIARFATSYSNLWKYGFYEGECYCVTGDQVSKTPPSGEYIKKGSFVVRGKRKYFKAALGLCIGVKKNRFVACPSSDSQKEMLDSFVELEPEGELEKNELAKEIVKFFVEHAKEEKKEDIERMATYEKVLRFLPPGKSRVKGVYPRS